MALDQRAHLVLPRRVVQFLHLRQKAFAQVARAATERVEHPYRRQHAENVLLVRAGGHYDVRYGSAEVAVVVDVADQHFGQRVVGSGDLGERHLRLQVLL